MPDQNPDERATITAAWWHHQEMDGWDRPLTCFEAGWQACAAYERERTAVEVERLRAIGDLMAVRLVNLVMKELRVGGEGLVWRCDSCGRRGPTPDPPHVPDCPVGQWRAAFASIPSEPAGGTEG